MTVPHRLSTAAFLIGLGIVTPVLAQNAGVIIPQPSTTFSDGTTPTLQPVLNMHPQSVSLLQNTTTSTQPPSEADLQHADQILTNDKSQMQGDQTALSQLNLKLQSDQRMGNAYSVQQDQKSIQALQQKIVNDQALVKDDRTQARALLQTDTSTVKADRQNVVNSQVQLRNDEQNNNAAAVQQDLINERAAKQVLKTDGTILRHERDTAGLIKVNNTTGVATGVGSGTNIGTGNSVSGTVTTNPNSSTVSGPPAESDNGTTTTTPGTTSNTTSNTTTSTTPLNHAVPTTSNTTGQVIVNDPSTAGTDPNMVNAGTAASAGLGPNGSVPASTGLPTGSTAVPASSGLPTTQSTTTDNTNSAAVPSSMGLPPNPNTVGHAPETPAQGATGGGRDNPAQAISGGGRK